MIKINMTVVLIRPLRAVPLMLGLVLLAASCATKPPEVPSLESTLGDFALLPPGGTVYCCVDISVARPIMDRLSLEGMSGRDLAEALDRSVAAVAAFYPPESSRRYLAVARGNYPVSRINAAFSLDSHWKKLKSATGPSYWYSASQKLAVSLNVSRALVSDADPLISPPGVQAPEGFGDLVRDSEGVPRPMALAGWIESAADPLNRFLASLELPLQIPAEQVLFAVYPAENDAPRAGEALVSGAPAYQALIRLKTPSATQARALTTLFAMTRLFIGNAALTGGGESLSAIAPLFANPPVQEEADLILRTGVMEERQVALLFNLFSVYSK